jgi:hypothetical protein
MLDLCHGGANLAKPCFSPMVWQCNITQGNNTWRCFIMSSNENAKANPKKMSKIRGCGCLLIIFVIVIIILAIIGNIVGDDGKGEQNAATEQVLRKEQQEPVQKEQIKNDSLTVEQAKKDSLMKEVLLIENTLAELEEEKKNMSTQMQEIRKVAIRSGEDIGRLERAYNIDLKEINNKIKNYKDIKKILVKNLKEK